MSAPRRACLAAAVAAAAASGCAYFNGMYYANHYTRLAQTSERAGRIGEARDRWSQAEMHAESLISRHPTSSWVVDAQLVRGRALVHLELYSDAVLALQAAKAGRISTARRLEALGLLGHAYLQLGMLDSAGAALDSAADAREASVRDEALLDRGRLLEARHQPDQAREDLARSRDPLAAYDLAQVDLQLGDTAAAGALFDSLAGAKVHPEAEWRAGLDSLAAAGDGAHASQLVQRLVGGGLSSGARARLLLDDAGRLLRAADTAGATTDLRAVVAVARDSVTGQMAAVTLCRLGIAVAAADSDLEPQRGRLVELVQQGGSVGREAQEPLRLLARLDTLAAAPKAADAFWFLRAELLRDSLHAGRLAAAAFAAMATEFPDSPWTPKALVAAIAAGSPATDSLREVLAQRYGASPYARAALGAGGGDSAYASLEDSLRRVLAVGPAPRVPGGAPGRRPGMVGGMEDAPRRTRPVPAPSPRPAPQPSGPPSPEPPR